MGHVESGMTLEMNYSSDALREAQQVLQELADFLARVHRNDGDVENTELLDLSITLRSLASNEASSRVLAKQKALFH